jgi:4-amino-4-deoxy-L-arabinose transferase-like glycosyltransferase
MRSTAATPGLLEAPARRGVTWSSILSARTLVWAGLLGTALGLRAWGLTWGGRLDLNPDESLILQIASGLSLENLNPRFFSYCGFVFNQSVLTMEVLGRLGIQLSDFGRLMMHRSWSVAWGVGTVVLVYHLARRMGGSRRAGYLAAGLMAILPLHVWESHFGTTDAPLLFFMMASVLSSLLFYERPTWMRAALPGLFAGFAVGTKYPGAFPVFPFFAAVALLLRERRLGVSTAVARTLTSGAAALAGAFLVSPFSFLEYQGTIEAFWYEYDTVGSGHFGFDLNASGWQYHRVIYELLAGFPFGFGVPLWLLVVAGLVFHLRRPSPPVVIGLVYVACFFAVTGRWIFVPVRYFMPMFPVFIVFAGLFLDWLLRTHRRVGFVVGSLVVAYTLAFTATTTHRFVTDTRIAATEWVNRVLVPGSTIIRAHARSQDAYTASFDRTRFPRVRSEDLRDLHGRAQYYAEQAAATGRRDLRVYVSASSLDYDRYYRTRVPESIEAWDQIRRNPERYRLIRAFETWFLNKRFYMWLDPMFGGYFLSPRLEFYQYVPEVP